MELWTSERTCLRSCPRGPLLDCILFIVVFFCEMKNLKHFMDSSVIAVQDLENLFEK